ncbi:hypothetical protein [Companilactobacillus hulinensis]|uniref:hypothetical protein n=1 Tax=Companilactobacillus hulinensis TaxID=2486007 RepID=UPI000F780A36|nr:hypothetical protein [Companilactobacillus hulinensis]
MKKAIIGMVLAVTAVLGSANVVQAAEKTYTFEATDTIVITASSKKDSKTYPVYKKAKGKMIKTGKSEKMNKGDKLQYWRANSVKMGKTDWWQIANNKYFKSDRVAVVDTARMEELGQKFDNYANYTPDLPTYEGGNAVVVIGAAEKGNSRTIGVYKLKNDKLVYTGNRVNMNKGKTIQHWKANRVTINGEQVWQVGNNLYFKSKRVTEVNTVRMNELEQKIDNYGNYPG